MKNEEESLNDLEEDLNLEDFEDFEEEEDDEIDISGIEYDIFPLYKERITQLPKSVDPKKIIKMKKVYLYSPLNITSAYTPIGGYQINMENIQGRFLTIRPNGNFQKEGNKRLAQTISKLKSNIKDFEDNIAKSNKNNHQKHSPKNKNNNKNN